MTKFTYDITKRKAEVQTDNKDVGENVKSILLVISICATALIGLNMYIEYQKYLSDQKERRYLLWTKKQHVNLKGGKRLHD